MKRFEKIDRLKENLDSYRPLPAEILANLEENLILRWTYHSNAIEGNTLTLKETKVALEGITIGGKTMREHFEAINHREAIYYVQNLVKKKEPLTAFHIRSIHQLILKNIDDKNAGTYRKSNITISGAEHIPPEGLLVESEMQKFMDWYKNEAASLHPIESAARLHVDFVKIHPFTDGNGRTARLLTNLELMKAAFPPIILPVEKRLEYYEALDLAHTTDNYEKFFDLMADLAENAFTPYWHALGVTL